MKSHFKISGRNASVRQKFHARWMLIPALFSLSFDGLIAAEGPLVAVQEALIREQLLSSPATGALDDATRAALLRFQIRRGLPATGEMDTATMQALQNPAPSAQPPAPAPPTARAPEPPQAIVEKDREFLEKVESGQQPSGSEPAVPAEPPAPSTAAVQSGPPPEPRPISVASPAPPKLADQRDTPPPKRTKSENAKRKLRAEKVETPEEPRQVTARRVEDETSSSGDLAQPKKRAEKASHSAASPRKERHASRTSAGVADGTTEPSPAVPPGVRVITTTTTERPGPDGRTYIVEKKTIASPEAPHPEVRRALPVERRSKPPGLFDGIFNDDD